MNCTVKGQFTGTCWLLWTKIMSFHTTLESHGFTCITIQLLYSHYLFFMRYVFCLRVHVCLKKIGVNNVLYVIWSINRLNLVWVRVTIKSILVGPWIISDNPKSIYMALNLGIPQTRFYIDMFTWRFKRNKNLRVIFLHLNIIYGIVHAFLPLVTHVLHLWADWHCLSYLCNL